MGDLFDTDEKKNAGISAFVSLKETAGWKLLEQIWDENVKVLQMQLENGMEGETIETVQRVRDKLSLLREVRSTPDTMIRSLQPLEQDVINSDPYLAMSDLPKSE